ncbi:glycosyltransferase [Patescibacteria group bacterium]
MFNEKIAGYCIIKKTDNLPFYDSIYQCLRNVDEFHIFYVSTNNDKNAFLINQFVKTLSPFYSIVWHEITDNSDAQIYAKQYLKNKGYNFILYIKPDEFFPTGLKPFLIECAQKNQTVKFPIFKISEDAYSAKIDYSTRFFQSDNNAFNDSQNCAEKTYPEAIHIFTANKNQVNEKNNFPIREREQLVLRHCRQHEIYPFSEALKEIIEDCSRKKNNAENLNINFSNTKGYKESMNISLTWTESYGVTESLIKKFNVKNMAEIGVARGHHSMHLLEALPDLHLYSIDPWGHFIKEHKCMFQKEQNKMDALYNYVSSMLKPFKDKSTIIRSTSKRAIKEIKDPLDMIFIDADHSYESIKEDLGLWWDKVKTGGIISGHDYNHSCHPGVTKAVNEYFGNKGLKVNAEIGNVWWVQKQQETISYIIPTYNAENYLEETVNSIFNQNLKIPFEVLITDDCSSDGTPNIIKKLAEKYSEINFFLNSKNRGAPENRNFGIANSKGNFIYMLDHDNVLTQNSIQKLIDAINRRGCGAASFEELSFFKNEISNHRGSWIYKYRDNLFTIKEFITYIDSPVASNNYMFTRPAFEKTGGYPERGARENMGFGLRLTATGTAIAIVPNTKYYHRILSTGMWLKENNEHPERAHKNMALNYCEFLPLFDAKSQQLITSEKASTEADNYIKDEKLKLSEKGWQIAGGKDRYRSSLVKKIYEYKNKFKKNKHFFYLKFRKFLGDNNVAKIKKIINVIKSATRPKKHSSS